jgi:hypothetical protein
MAIPGNGWLTATVYAACTTCQATRKRRTKMIRTAHDDHLRGTLIAMAMLVATLVTLAGAKPAEAKLACFPEGHDPIGFENEGDI